MGASRGSGQAEGRYEGIDFARRAISVLVCSLLIAASATVPRAVADPEEPPTEAEPAPAWSYDPDAPIPEDDLQARMADEGIDRDEAVRRFRVEDATTLIEPEASTRWPQSFGGVWIEIDPFAVKVAFTSDAGAKVEALREDFPFPEVLVATEAPVSKALLEATQELMIADRTALQAGLSLPDLPGSIQETEGRYDLEIDLGAGQLVVGVEQAGDELRDAFQATYLNRLRLEVGLSAPGTCTIEDCRYAVLSGLKLNLYDANVYKFSYCSSAFTAYLEADPSVRYVLSAAHCSRDSQGNETVLHRRHVHEHIGRSTKRKMAGTTDAERIWISNAPFKDSSKAIVDGIPPRMIDAYKTYANISIGDYVGKTGARTGTTRGYVKSKTYAPWWVPNSSKFFRASYCAAAGDSGSGVWIRRKALGIHTGHHFGYTCESASDYSFSVGHGIFGAIEFALDKLQVGLLTNRNIRPRARFTSSCTFFDCTFSGDPSYDWDGEVATYAWNFGDGTTGSGKNPSKSYTTPGEKTVTLTVTDNDGRASPVRSETVTIVTSLPTL